jgi:2-oxoisovalerate dehydrogenase E1 component
MPSKQVEEIAFDLNPYTAEELLEIYRQMLLPRLIEEKMLILLRQGKISKWFSAYGQEAIAVGAGMALAPDELIFTLHRNLGVFTVRQVPLDRLFAQWQGKSEGFTRGRDRSFHFGSRDHHIVGMISHLGAQLSLAAGAALASRLKGEKKVTLAFTGDGGTSEGEFHEALNVAAVWELPVIFLIENNGYGLSTPVGEQFRCEQLADRGKGYGMRSLTIDGNNILEVYGVIRELARQLREKPEPILLECMTFRRRGHEEASGTRYVPESLMAYWEARDPIHHFENRLLEAGILDENRIEHLRREHKKQIQAALEIAFSAPLPKPDIQQELGDVYAPSYAHQPPAPDAAVREMRFVDALSDGLRESLIRHPELIFMGQDIAEYGGVFKITDGLVKAFGKERIRNTPLCESAIIGAGLGLSLKGFKSMVEMQFADFVSCGFNQIVNNLAKLHYR